MISFRYHLVSIVSVFLALALGVLVGTTVVNQGVINDLNHRTDTAAANAEKLREQVVALQSQSGSWSAFAAAVESNLIDGQLTGIEAVLVTQQDVDPGEAEAVRRSLESAGAIVVGEVVVTGRMALTDQGSRRDLATLLGTTDDASQPDRLPQTAALRLGSRLANGLNPTPNDADLLDQMRTAGFLTLRGGATSADIGGAGQAMVLLTGSGGRPTLDPALFLSPLAGFLVESLRPVAALETSDSAYPFVALIRDDRGVDGHLVTVDNVDQIPGHVALVLGLRNLLAVPGAGGDYGVKDGASAPIPKP